ncbi:hypothetical protein D3C87_1882870 [compost metagenome]
MTVERAAGLSRHDPLFRADQQFFPELAFQRDDLLAQSRLGDMQDGGGPRKAADINDLHECL